jgi:heme exporter protein B
VWRDAALVAGKDLRLEWRSRVTTNQVMPFAVLVLVLFAFALNPDNRVLVDASPGLFWLAVLFSSILAIQRAFSVESHDGIRDSLRMSGLNPAGVFLGKAAGIAIHLAAVEVVLGAGVIVLYGAHLHGPVLFVLTCVAATAGLAAAGTLYGVLAAGLRVRETLLPLLQLPIVVPVLIAATQASRAAFAGTTGEGWRYLALLVIFAVIYIGLGLFAFDPLLEES